MNSHLRSQSGQTMVEYLLMLVCVLAIGLGIIWQFNKSFRDYTQGYFGNYVACLLRAGELPSLGAPSASATAQQNANGASSGSGGSSCSSEFKSFSLNGSNSSSAAKSGANNSSSDSAAAKNAANKGGAGGSGGGGNGGNSAGGGTDGGSSGNASAGYNARFNTNGNKSGRQHSVPLSKADPGGGSAGFELKLGKNDLETIQNGGHLYGSSGDYGGGYVSAESEPKAAVVPKRVPANEQDTRKKKGTLISADYQRNKVTNEDQDETYSFTNIFRWVIILCILIMMLIFFGGQAARISKSMDKSD